MAVLNDDENLDPTKPAAGGASGFIGGGSSGQGATTSKAPTSSGSYTNLMSYIGANQGNDATMGKAASGMVDTAGKAADDAIGAYGTAGAADAKQGTANVGQGFLGQINAGTAKLDSGKVDAINHGVMNGVYSGPDSVNAGGYTGPTAAPSTSYTGQTDPTKLAEAGNAYSSINKLVGTDGTHGLVGLAGGGQSGVGTLLRGAYAQPSYSAGENQLDSFLTGAGPGGQAALKGIKDTWGGEGDKLNSAETGIRAAQKAGQDTSSATGETYTKAINDAQKASGDVQDQYNTMIGGQKDRANAMKDAMDRANATIAATIAKAKADHAAAPTAAAPAPAAAAPGGKTGKVPNAPTPIQAPTSQWAKNLINVGKQGIAAGEKAVNNLGTSTNDANKALPSWAPPLPPVNPKDLYPKIVNTVTNPKDSLNPKKWH